MDNTNNIAFESFLGLKYKDAMVIIHEIEFKSDNEKYRYAITTPIDINRLCCYTGNENFFDSIEEAIKPVQDNENYQMIKRYIEDKINEFGTIGCLIEDSTSIIQLV